MQPRDHTKYHTEGQQNFLHTCASVDDTHMARTILTLQHLVVAVICPAS